jgi:hypothetical protein
LVIAGGGSYNRAKDLPTLGSTVFQACHGDPSPEYGWGTRERSTHNDQPLLLPRGDFKNLEAAAQNDPEVKSWILRRQERINVDYLEVI